MTDSTQPPAPDAPDAARADAPSSAVGEVAGASPAVTAEADAVRTTHRRVYLLQQLADAPGRTLARGQANRKITMAAAEVLGLDAAAADRLRNALAAEGLLRTATSRGTTTYELTEPGAAYLRAQGPLPPEVTRGAYKPAKEPAVEEGRKTYLLLQLLQAEGWTLTQDKANRFDAAGRTDLDLNAATARRLRQELAVAGLVAIDKQGRQETYRLTPQGRLHLGAASFLPGGLFTLRGQALNDLLEAARDAAKQFEPPARPAAPAGPATPAAAPRPHEPAVL